MRFNLLGTLIKRTALFVSVAFGLSACGGPLATADAVQAGFQKESTTIASMLGATSGWYGHWNGNEVELYEYEPDDKVPEALFSGSVDAGLWNTFCRNGNLAMVSSGEKACKALKSL